MEKAKAVEKEIGINLEGEFRRLEGERNRHFVPVV